MSADQRESEARCRFYACQAGGVILEGAPRVMVDHGSRYVRDLPEPVVDAYHPGCWAAECAVEVDAEILDEPPFDAGPPVTISAFGGLVVPARCGCVDESGDQCVGVAGEAGFCAECAAQPAPVVVFS